MCGPWIAGMCFMLLGFWDFAENNIALGKKMFDSQMSQVKGGSGIIVVVRIAVVLQLDSALVCGCDGVIESHTFVGSVMRDGE
jgi:hypothetical protein